MRDRTFFHRNKPVNSEEDFKNAIARNQRKTDISNSVFEDMRNKKRMVSGGIGGYPALVQPTKGLPTVASSVFHPPNHPNLNIPQLSPEIKGDFDENTKAHVRALYKWKRQGEKL